MTESGGASPEIVSLADSIEPLKDHFNSNKDRLRMLALVSAT
jgi:hypothetical protein